MELTPFQLLEVLVGISAVTMLGSTNSSRNLFTFSIHTALLSFLTGWVAFLRSEPHLYVVAVCFFAVKAAGAPAFLRWITRQLGIENDSNPYMSATVSMHFGIVLMGISYVLARDLPGAFAGDDARYGASAALTVLFVGVLFMLTRKTALSQIVGFLVIENGIFLFTLVKTHGMPLAVEMGILLDVLVGVMIVGLLMFRIKKNFEHIDVSKLRELKD